MDLSNDEIERRAYKFASNWCDYDKTEIAETQSFWNDFFLVFGKHRKELAQFEEPVIKASGTKGRIDVFWPGELLVEQKAPNVALNDKIASQAFDYVEQLTQQQKPKRIVLCNFKEFKIINLHTNEIKEFSLDQLPKYYREFNFIAGYSDYITYQEEEISLQAAELLAKLYTAIEKGDNEPSLELNYFMIQLLYCFLPTILSFLSGQLLGTPFIII